MGVIPAPERGHIMNKYNVLLAISKFVKFLIANMIFVIVVKLIKLSV
jgi:hypothetical protein